MLYTLLKKVYWFFEFIIQSHTHSLFTSKIMNILLLIIMHYIPEGKKKYIYI